MDPLVEIPVSQWSELMKLYEGLADGIAAYCLLDTHLTHPDFIEKYNFKVLAPYGDISNGMIAVCDVYGDRETAIHPLNFDRMEEALLKTNAIDWRDAHVASASRRVEVSLNRLSKQLSIQISNAENVFKHVLRKSAAPYTNLSCPANTYVGKLTPEHLEIVDKTWTYHSETSHKFFQDLILNDLTYVLYSETGQPLAWVTVGCLGCLTHLYCVKECRRMGYAEFITKLAVNDQILKGKDVLAYTVEGNPKAQSLFDKLGFERIGCVKWLSIKKI